MTPLEPDAGFARDVLASTSGSACPRARLLLGGIPDAPLAPIDRTLVEAHLERCEACRVLAAALPAVIEALPALAEADPGPGFTARVMDATVRSAARTPPAPWRDRWLGWWDALAARPRIAWEAAYVLTLVLVLVVGDPVKAWDSAAAGLRTWSVPATPLTLPGPNLSGARSALANRGARMADGIETARVWVARRAQGAAAFAAAMRAGRTASESRLWLFMAEVAEVAERWGLRALSWASDLLGTLRPAPGEPRTTSARAVSPAPPATEPPAGAMRSSDRTETTR